MENNVISKSLIDVVDCNVICNHCSCNGDDTDSDGKPRHKGGGVVGSDTVCQACLDLLMAGPRIYSENILIFDPDKSFGDNVRDFRIILHQNSDFYNEANDASYSDAGSVICTMCEGRKVVACVPIDIKAIETPEIVLCPKCHGRGAIALEVFIDEQLQGDQCCKCENPEKKVVCKCSSAPSHTCADCGKQLETI